MDRLRNEDLTIYKKAYIRKSPFFNADSGALGPAWPGARFFSTAGLPGTIACCRGGYTGIWLVNDGSCQADPS
jgi:hypothetical protein